MRHAGGEENCRNGGKVPTLRYAEDGAPGKSKAKAWATCLLVPTCPVTAASSDGRRNTCSKFTRRSLKSQGLSWALIQAQRDSVEMRLRVDR